MRERHVLNKAELRPCDDFMTMIRGTRPSAPNGPEWSIWTTAKGKGPPRGRRHPSTRGVLNLRRNDDPRSVRAASQFVATPRHTARRTETPGHRTNQLARRCEYDVRSQIQRSHTSDLLTLVPTLISGRRRSGLDEVSEVDGTRWRGVCEGTTASSTIDVTLHNVHYRRSGDDESNMPSTGFLRKRPS